MPLKFPNFGHEWSNTVKQSRGVAPGGSGSLSKDVTHCDPNDLSVQRPTTPTLSEFRYCGQYFAAAIDRSLLAWMCFGLENTVLDKAERVKNMRVLFFFAHLHRIHDSAQMQTRKKHYHQTLQKKQITTEAVTSRRRLDEPERFVAARSAKKKSKHFTYMPRRKMNSPNKHPGTSGASLWRRQHRRTEI